MKNSKKRTAILTLMGTTLMLQSSLVKADSNIVTEGSNLEASINQTPIITELVPKADGQTSNPANTESVQKVDGKTSNSPSAEEGNNLEINANEMIATTPSAVMLIGQGNAYIDSLQQKINDILAKIQDREKTGTVFAQNELDQNLYLLSSPSHDSLDYLNQVIDSVKQLVTTDQAVILKASDDIQETYDKLRTIEIYKTFSGVNGSVWKDTNGVKIQAHGGQVQKIGGKWWWYGEDHTNGYRSNGISAYSSIDLYNWKFEGYVMRTISNREQLNTDPYFSEVYKDYSDTEKDNVYLCVNDSHAVIERPKMIYNKNTGKYVLWFHADGPTVESPNSDYAAAMAGVAISDSPNGPFKFLGRYRLNVCPEADKKGEWYEKSAGFARDMNLWVDDDGTAYIIYSSEENRTMFISKLNADYTNLATDVDKAVKGIDFVRLFPGAQREAPAVFKYNNKYYMITSSATGWDPNQARYWVADDILGEWTDMGDPCIGDTDKKTFYTQSTNVIPIDANSGKFIYMGDRWKSSDLSDSRYVWLPLEFDPNGKLLIKSYTDWTTDDLNNKYSIKLNTSLEDVYTSVYDLPSTVNISVYENGQWVNKDTTVTWKVPELTPTVQTTISGTLDAVNREIQTDIIDIPKNLEYYIDCGNTLSDTFNLINKNSSLQNSNASDEVYTEGSWGYSSVIGTDIDLYGTSSTNSFQTGYWAHSGKTIDYKVPLKAGNYNLFAGFNEWWSTNRTMGVSISYKDANGQVVKQNLGTFTNKGQKTVDYSFKLPVDSDVTISVYKPSKSNPDVILSWLAIQFDNVEISKDENPNMKDLYTGVDELPQTLNIKAFENNEWVSKNTTVKWDIPTLNSMEQATVTGTLSYNGKKIKADIINVPKNLQYFIDCGVANGSTLYDLINEKVQLTNNDKADQAYKEGKWGYVGEIGTDIDYKNSDSTDAYNSGFWAYSGKNIEYAVPLKAGKYNLFAGFNEWWGANRTISIRVSYTNASGQLINQELGTFTSNTKKLVNYEFELPEEAKVTISVYKPNVGNPDVILSWLALEKIIPEYAINVEAGEHGSISPSGAINIEENKSQTFTITPDSGWEISDVKVDGVSVGAVSSYTFEDVTKAHTISATFKIKHSSSKSSSSSVNNTSDKVTINAGEASIISAINNATTKTIIVDVNNFNNTNNTGSNTETIGNTPLISKNILKDLKANVDKTLVIKTAESSIEIKSKDGQIQFTENNVAVTGFKSVGQAEYYLNESGIMQTGWVQTQDKNWYHLNLETGIKEKNWVKETNGNWYYLDNTSGVMKTGWIKDNETWYYLNNDGSMKTGWLKDSDGGWYYLDTSGAMASNTTIDGYQIGANGALI